MRVPTRSEGTRSGVNWTRANLPPSTAAVVLIVRVLASPGTPSIRRCPWASRQTSTRSSIASCPAITLRISNSACSRRSLASAVDAVTLVPPLVAELRMEAALYESFIRNSSSVWTAVSSGRGCEADDRGAGGRAPPPEGAGTQPRQGAEPRPGLGRARGRADARAAARVGVAGGQARARAREGPAKGGGR